MGWGGERATTDGGGGRDALVHVSNRLLDGVGVRVLKLLLAVMQQHLAEVNHRLRVFIRWHRQLQNHNDGSGTQRDE